MSFKRFIFLLPLLLMVAPVMAQDTAPSIEPTSCWMELAEGLVEGQNVECGYLIVPEDRTNPSSPTIQLAYAVLRAPSDSPKPDPVIYLAGGPGGNAVGELNAWVGTTYLEDRDLILLDQRGTGFSQPTLNCPEVEQGEENGLQACHDRLVGEGVNLQAYNSVENAADVADLRVALGYDEWNLFGISYGTRLALTVMRDHPEGVRSVIIDSVYPPEVSSWEEYGANTADVFHRLFQACAANAECDAAYPDLENTFYDTVAKLNTEPASYSGTAKSGDSEDKTMSGSDFIDRLFQVMYSSENIPAIPMVISEVANGNYTALDDLESGQSGEPDRRRLVQSADEDVSDSEGMNNSVDCQEEVAFNDENKAIANVPADPPLMHDNSVAAIQSTFSDCQIWGVKAADKRETQPVVSDIPTLVVAGEFDPITPAKWAQSAASHLSNSTFFLFPGGGHGVIDLNECTMGIMQAFLEDPTAKPDGSCVADITEPQWVLPS
ncbi:MAG: alpha/beta fold hydrolase [Anaerolineaceae bacterium]|nr:alpha/beta fold hydrolase [Anaerolineaceae bacterium]